MLLFLRHHWGEETHHPSLSPKTHSQPSCPVPLQSLLLRQTTQKLCSSSPTNVYIHSSHSLSFSFCLAPGTEEESSCHCLGHTQLQQLIPTAAAFPDHITKITLLNTAFIENKLQIAQCQEVQDHQCFNFTAELKKPFWEVTPNAFEDSPQHIKKICLKTPN